MKQRIKRISAVLAMAMALSAFSAFSVFAEGEGTSAPGQCPSTSVASAGVTTLADDESNSTTDPAPSAYVAGYTVSKVDGLDNFWDWDERFDVNLTIYDPQNVVTMVRLVNTAIFSGDNYHGTTDLTPSPADESGNRTVTLKEVTYHGGGNTMEIQLSSDDGGVSTTSITIAQCMDVNPDPPEPTPHLNRPPPRSRNMTTRRFWLRISPSAATAWKPARSSPWS